MGKSKIVCLFLVLLFFIQCKEQRANYKQVYRDQGERELYYSLKSNLKSFSDVNYQDLIIFHDSINPNIDTYIFSNIVGDYKLIKAPFILHGEKDIKWENHFSGLIDIENFNSYVNNKKIDSKYLFLQLLSYGKNYEVITEVLDLNKLVSKHPIKPSSEGGEFVLKLDSKELIKEILELRKYERLCWFSNFGLVKFRFNLENKTIKSVDSYFIGYLGNENIVFWGNVSK